MNLCSLAEKCADHRLRQTEICFERKGKRIDWLQSFKNRLNTFPLKSFDKFLKQYSGLLGEGVKNNENSFFFQMKSSDINLSNKKQSLYIHFF